MKPLLSPKLTCFVLLILGSSLLYGQKSFQPGYIINLSGDTIKGSIENRNWDINPKKVSFKKNAESPIEFFTPEEIKEFGVLCEIYKSAIVKVDANTYELANLTDPEEYQYRVDTTFLHTLVQGSKSLFLYKDFNRKEHLLIGQDSGFELLRYKKYIQNNNGVKTIAENKRYIGQLNLYLQDCPSVFPKISHSQYAAKNLISIFQDYYKCRNEPVKFIKKEENPKISFGVLSGLSITKLTFKGNHNDNLVYADFSPSANPTFGCFFEYSLPRNFNKLSFNNELIYMSYKTEGVYTSYHSVLGYSYIQLNNMLRYKFPVSEKLSFFTNAGITNGFFFKETNYMYREYSTYRPDNIEKALKNTRKYEQGYNAGLGAKYKKLSFEIRYERGSGMSEYLDLGSDTDKAYFIFGYQL